MADNTLLNSGSGGDTIATDDISGVKHQRVKVQYGADGSATDVSDTNPLPIDDAGGSITVDIGVAATAATNLAKAEDAVHASGDVGVMSLAVRNDTLASLVGTDGDYAAFQVDADGALYTTLGDNAGVAIGDVDVTSVIPGTGATNLGKAEDAVHSSSDVGVMSLFVRQDTQSDFGADGDYVPASVDANGAIRVNAINADGTSNADTVAGQTDAGAVILAIRDDTLSTLPQAELDYAHLRVNSTGALHVTGGGGGTEYTEDVATANPIIGSAILMERDDALSALTPIEGDWASFRCGATGALWTDVNSVTPGTGATNLGKAEDAAHSSGDVGVMSLAVRNDTLAPLAGADGDYAPIQVDELGAVFGNQGNRISTTSFNSRDAATLAASATFQGVGEDVSKYGRVGVSIVSDNATDGVLTIEVSRDDVTYGGPTRTWADTRFAQPHMWNIVEKYFRIKYVNGTTEATNLAIQVQYSNNANILLGHQLDETLIPETEAIITRSVIVGQDPNAVFVNAPESGVDDDNSSIVNLTAATSLVFTGTFHNISGFTGVTVLIDGTSGGAVSGTLQMQFSHDGVTVHRDISVTTTDVRDTLPRTLGVVAKFFRIIFTADADLTSFQAQTMIHTEQVHLVSRANSTLQGSEDVTNVRSILVGQTGGGSFVNIKASAGGALSLDLADVDGNTVEVGAGNLSTGVQRVSIATDDVNMSAVKTAVELIDDPIFADNAGFTLGTSKVDVAGGVFQSGTPTTLADNDAGAILLNSTAGQMVELMASTATTEVVGDIAHDAAAAGNPLLSGARATNNIEGLTQVAAADNSYLTSDLNGCIVTRPHTTPEEQISERVSNTNGTSTDFTNFAAGGAGVHNYVADVTITNTSSTDAYVDLRDGASGSIIWTFPAPANGGATHSFSVPLKGAANTALAFDVSAAITTMIISVNGYQAQG